MPRDDISEKNRNRTLERAINFLMDACRMPRASISMMLGTDLGIVESFQSCHPSSMAHRDDSEA